MKNYCVLILLMTSIHVFPQTKENIDPNYKVSKNAIVLGTDYGFFSYTVSYERIMEVDSNKYVTFRAGTGWNSGDKEPILTGEISFFRGRYKHYFEMELGALVWHPNYYPPSIIPTVGYRYMAPKGFQLKAGAGVIIDTAKDPDWARVFPWPRFSIGYRFDW